MIKDNFIPLQLLCRQYQVEMSFFKDLNENGLIEIQTVEKLSCVHQDHIMKIERMIRLHHDLDINIAGIDTIIHLLNRMEDLQSELNSIRNRLRIYED